MPEQGDIREFLRINFPHARVVSPTPAERRRNDERRRRNERRNVGVRTSDPPESLTMAQLVCKIERLESKLSGAYDEINIMKETFKKEMEEQEIRIKADAEERIKKAEETVENLRRMLDQNDVEHNVGEVDRQHVCMFVCLCQWLNFRLVTRNRCLIKFNYNICPFLPHFYLINM